MGLINPCVSMPFLTVPSHSFCVPFRSSREKFGSYKSLRIHALPYDSQPFLLCPVRSLLFFGVTLFSPHILIVPFLSCYFLLITWCLQKEFVNNVYDPHISLRFLAVPYIHAVRGRKEPQGSIVKLQFITLHSNY